LDVDHKLPPAKDNWAVVISHSTTWSNYRHQADAFDMYQTLRHHGYDEDHIVLIVEDNLYNNPNNKLLGQIFVERSDDPNVYDAFINDNVRNHAVVDYHFSQLEPQDVVDIMLGRQSDRLPHVIHPDSTSNVFFFWSGHGGSYDGPLWGNENAREYFGSKRLKDMVAQMDAANMYRRLMFCIETCYSGIWGEALEGFPDVLALTAANSIESSKADVHDSYLGVFLSNAFSRTFRRTVYSEPDIAIHALYKDLAKTTNGSHVSIYNESNYGSVFTNYMGDYLPE
jgi:glycosylphosphatidylinositol transamidase (GPIT) subunit GPI8